MTRFQAGDMARRLVPTPDFTLTMGKAYRVNHADNLDRQVIRVTTDHGTEGHYWAKNFEKVEDDKSSG